MPFSYAPRIIYTEKEAFMKVFVVGDMHWSQNSSVVRGMGSRYSVRLENLIGSVSWAEEEAIRSGAEEMVYLGDFFDRPELNSMEITALKEVKWNGLPHKVLVGNHDASVASLEYNSANVLSGLGFEVIDKPTVDGGTLYLPYIPEADRKPLGYYMYEGTRLIFSHNDIKGIRYGPYESAVGFPIGDIEASGALFVNGHLHNHCEVAKNVVDLGNLTGQNFSEDARAYPHVAMLLDLDTLEYEYIENPHALNFYKLEYPKDFPIDLKPNAVVSVKAHRKDAEALKGILSGPNVAFSRVTWEAYDGPREHATLERADHLAMFREYALGQLGNDPIAEGELSEVLR